MGDLWPWVSIAGLGALHGLHPANGWMFAAAWRLREGRLLLLRRTLLPVALGHAAAVAATAPALASGMAMDRAMAQGVAGCVLIVLALRRLWPAASRRQAEGSACGGIACHAALGAWSFLMACAHGSAMVLAPALASLCLGDTPAREITASGSLLLGCAAAAVHLAAMLAATGLLAHVVVRLAARPHLRWSGGTARRTFAAALALLGASLLLQAAWPALAVAR